MKYIFIVAITLIAVSVSAQIDDRLYGTPAQIKNLTTRILVVELMEEDPKVVEKLKKEHKQPELLANYSSFIKYYNQTIQVIVKKYWWLNKQIEYKGTTEVEKLGKAKNSKYAILRFYVMNDKSQMDYMDIRSLMYTRAENLSVRPDYFFFLPYAREVNNISTYNEVDFVFTIRLMQQHLDEIVKTNKIEKVKDWLETRHTANCGKLPSYKLLVDRGVLKDDVSTSDLSKKYPASFEITDIATITKAVYAEAEKTAYTVALPYGIGGTSIVTIKVVADAKTGDVLAATGYYKMGALVAIQFWPNHFKMLDECKMK